MDPAASPPTDIAGELLLSMVPGVGPRLRMVLLKAFETPSAVFKAKPSQLLQVPGIGPKLTKAILDTAASTDVAAILARLQELGVQAIPLGDAEYPRRLSEIPDPPGVLYVKGTITTADELSLAIVGSRHATQYGLQQAGRFAGGLARAGFTVTSGLARGVDAAAHRSAIEAGGRTLAVLGNGLETIYPPEHSDLAKLVTGSGALISELPLESPPQSGTFPQRNRLISGLSLAVLVIEAADRSGALITAQHALEQGRDVFCIPGRVDSRMSRGCHKLIRDGARLVESVEQIVEDLGPLPQPANLPSGEIVHKPAERLLNAQEQQVLNSVTSEAVTVDDVIAQSGLPAGQVIATLSVLEMRQLVKRLSGGMVTRR